MHKIDSDRSTTQQPPINPQGAASPGWFQDGDPTTGSLGTVISADWLNTVQAELLNAIEASGMVLDKTKTDQLKDSILSLIESNSVNGEVEGAANKIVRTQDEAGALSLSSSAELDESDNLSGLSSLSVGLGEAERDASAVLQVDSDSKGVLIPRMSQSARDAIAAPAHGLLVFNTTTQKLNIFRTGLGWSGIEAAQRPIQFSASGPYYVEGPQQGVAFERVPFDLSISSARLKAWYAGISGALRLDVMRSLDGGLTWESIFSVLPGLSYTTGDFAEVLGELNPAKVLLPAGSLLRLDIVDVQQGGDSFVLELGFA